MSLDNEITTDAEVDARTEIREAAIRSREMAEAARDQSSLRESAEIRALRTLASYGSTYKGGAYELISRLCVLRLELIEKRVVKQALIDSGLEDKPKSTYSYW